MTGFGADDLAAIRQEGSLVALFTQLAGKTLKPEPAAEQDTEPAYHIARPGAWPCGTAATGPTPPKNCPTCQPPGAR
ncbi:hypothetical protein [Streptomyces indicus]|uniref:Uncharacterized protein n=1 Tax=Streptomyces indicus TaxID=417292 RepID=A0A1G9IU82_9ACTN|nr:hypothetical protein [Streptomyces indicus]SDL28730.1 hypothetical protein SAMN05421806_12572 [Streptomyces indicus]